MAADDPFNLESFVAVQAPVLNTVLAELRAGHKAEPLDVVRLPAVARPRQVADRDVLRIDHSTRSRLTSSSNRVECSACRIEPRHCGVSGTGRVYAAR